MKDKIKVVDTSKHHKHHDLIIAWAKGAEIEFWCDIKKVWFPVGRPSWVNVDKYRIKPTSPAELELLIKEHRAMGKTIDRLTKELTK